MKPTAIIYSFSSHKTAKIAEHILEEFKDQTIEKVNAETITEEQFLKFDNLILGVPTWFDGELPDYWDEFGPALEDLSLKGKKIALYGLGDQKAYPENFLDAIGIMANLVESRKATIVGLWKIEGYLFEKSKAQRGENFVGLGLDFENQATLNKKRINSWVNQLKTEFS